MEDGNDDDDSSTSNKETNDGPSSSVQHLVFLLALVISAYAENPYEITSDGGRVVRSNEENEIVCSHMHKANKR